jgi:hypothetical protein
MRRGIVRASRMDIRDLFNCNSLYNVVGVYTDVEHEEEGVRCRR